MIRSVRPVVVIALFLLLPLPAFAAGSGPRPNKLAAVASVDKYRADLHPCRPAAHSEGLSGVTILRDPLLRRNSR